ncbi:MAG TPA: methionine--tRNA ligase subunit beta [Atribacteraceae bacterium]|nr:methionine--tRNA ligase subunit beta [Atribacteraceae bacterium]
MTVPEVHLGEFQNIDIRIGKVLEVERLEGTKALLVLKVNLGEEERTLVAGLAQYYSPEEIIGKQVVVLANLKPANIRGVRSQGMLLAAEDGNGQVSLLTTDREIKPGSRVR